MAEPDPKKQVEWIAQLRKSTQIVDRFVFNALYELGHLTLTEALQTCNVSSVGMFAQSATRTAPEASNLDLARSSTSSSDSSSSSSDYDDESKQASNASTCEPEMQFKMG